MKQNIVPQNAHLSQDIADLMIQEQIIQLSLEKWVTFFSGIQSPIYCDNRLFLGKVEAREKIVQGFLQMIQAFPPQDDMVIVGVATAGIPWATCIADQLGLPLGYARSKSKSHGLGKFLEGCSIEGKKVFLIEDLLSTGSTSGMIVESLQTLHPASIEVMAIFDYEFPKNIYKENKIAYSSLTNFSAVLKMFYEKKILKEDIVTMIEDWHKDICHSMTS